MKVLILVLVTLAVRSGSAGKALPQKSQNYVTRLFRGINPNIEWDRTNYLVAVSGQHSQCQYNGVSGVSYQPVREAPGQYMTVIQDSGMGREVHADAIDDYVPRVMADWSRRFRNHIKTADKFGCSAEPGCSGRLVVACLFTPSVRDAQQDRPAPRRRPTTTTTTTTTIAVPRWVTRKAPVRRPGGTKNFRRNPRATAFSSEERRLVEEITGTSWDRSNYLAILSAYDISCSSMVVRGRGGDWKARTKAREGGVTIKGVYASKRIRRNTRNALYDALKRMRKPRGARKVGCSIIQDCKKGGRRNTYVLANCIFKM